MSDGYRGPGLTGQAQNGRPADEKPNLNERAGTARSSSAQHNSESSIDTVVVPKVTAPPGDQPATPASVAGGGEGSTSGRDGAGVERSSAGSTAKSSTLRRTRKARLRLSRLDPWSVMKTAFLFSIAAGIMLVVAVYVVWTVIGESSLFDSINEIVKSVVSTPGDTTPFLIQEYVNTQKVMGVTALLACVDVIIFTALATLASFLYNLAATMLGGLEVTLAED